MTLKCILPVAIVVTDAFDNEIWRRMKELEVTNIILWFISKHNWEAANSAWTPTPSRIPTDPDPANVDTIMLFT